MPTLGGSSQNEKQWSDSDFYTGSKSRAYPTYRPRVEKISGQSKYASPADEAIARPFRDVGKANLNLFDVGGAEAQTRQALEAQQAGQPPQPGANALLQNLNLPWMDLEKGESLGGVPGMGLVGNGLDFLSHLASPITQERDRPAGIYAQELFNKMRDTPDEQLDPVMRQVKTLNQGLFSQPADSPIMQGKQIGEMYKQFLVAEGHSRGTSNVLLAENMGEGPDFSMLGGALQGYGMLSAMLRRAIGSAPWNDQLQVLRDEKNTDEDIGEERAEIRQRWKSGELNDEEARDMIAMSSMALTNPNPLSVGDEWGPVDTIANLAVAMAGELVSDPLTYVTFGSASVAKFGAKSALTTITSIDRSVARAAVTAAAKAAGHTTPEAVAKFAASSEGQDIALAAGKAFAKESENVARTQMGGQAALRHLPKASTAAAKATGQVEASAVTSLDRLSAIQSMGTHGASPYADAIKAGIEGAGISGHMAVKAPKIVQLGQAIDRMTDPLSLFGYWRTGKQVPMIMSKMAAHGYTDALGWRVVRGLDDKLNRAGADSSKVESSRSIAAANHTAQAADAKNTQRMVSVNSAFVGTDLPNPTEAAIRHAGRNGEIRRLVKDQVDRTLEFILPASKGGAAQAEAEWRDRAVKQMVEFGADEAAAREVVADMSEREMRALANDHWGLMIDQVDAAKRKAMGAPTPTWDQKKISRITFMGPRQMAQQDARTLREKIATGDVLAVRQAVRQYRDLNQFISEGLDDSELMDSVSHVLDQLDNHLPVKIEDMTDMPQGIVDWDNAHPGYNLMLRPDDNDLLVPIRNKAGTVIGANTWLDHITERTPALEISAFKAMREDLLRGVSGGELERNAARRFAYNMAERVGLSEAESASIMRSIRETAETVETSPRGLTAEQILKATTDAKAISPQRKMMASRVVRDAMFDAYENEMRLVGVLPKVTGWVKKTAATVPGGDTISWASDFLYPLARFKKNPLFFLQEVPEAPFFLALQGRYPISGMMPGRLAGALEAVPGPTRVIGRTAREAKERVTLWNERTQIVMDRMTRMSPNAEYDQYEIAELTKLGMTTAANMTDGRTGLGRLLKGWASLPDRKKANVTIAVRAEFGEQWRRSLMQNAPEQWRAVRAFYPDEMSDGEVAVEWALDLMARSDPDSIYSQLAPSSFQAGHIGKRAEVSDELLRYFVYGEGNGKTWTDLTNDIKTGQVSIDQLRRDLMDRGADPDYVERAVQRLTFGTADEFYEAANTLGIHTDTTEAWRASNRVAAELQGLSEEEYLVRNFVGRPLSTDQMGNVVGDTLFDDIVLSMKSRGKAIPDSNHPDVAQLKVVTNDFITGVLRPAPVPLKPVTGPIDIPTDPAELLTWSQIPDLMPEHLVALRARGEEITRLLEDKATPRNMRAGLNKESKAISKAIPEVSRTISSPTVMRDGVPHRIVAVPATMPKGAPEDARKAAAKVRGWEKTRAERAANPRLHRPPTRAVEGAKGEPVPGYDLHFEDDPFISFYDREGMRFSEASFGSSGQGRSVQVTDKDGKVVGFVYAYIDPDTNTMKVAQSQVLDPHGRKGIGNWMYRQLEEKTGATLAPSVEQSPTARALWAQPDRPFGPPKRTVREYKTANELGHLQPVGESIMRDPHSLSLTGRRLDEERYLDVTDAPNGIREPVLVDPQGRIIDGNDRVQLAREMGIQVPTQVVDFPGPAGVPPARFGFDANGKRTLPPKFEAEGGYVYRTVSQNRLGQDWEQNTFVSRDPKGIYATTNDAVMLRTREDVSPWEAAAGGVDADVNSTSQRRIWAEDIEMLGDDGKWYPVLPPGRDQPLYQTALHTIGVTTPRQYRRQIETMMDPVAMAKRGMRAMTEKDVRLAIDWYDHMRRATFALVDDNLTGDERIMEAARVLVAFGTTQLNTSPADGYRHVFKAYGMKARGEELQLGEARNIVQQAVGLNPEQLHALVWNDQAKISQMGIAQKLFDFIDSLTGSKTRTNGILGPKGDWGPVAVDIHTKRDFGYLDPAMGGWVYRLVEIQKGTQLVHGVSSKFVKEGGAPGAEIGHFVVEMSDGTTEIIPKEHIGAGVPTDGEYDFGVELGNDIRDHFNETNFMGRQWSSYEVQALGWYRMQLLKSSEGDAGEVANAVFEQSRWMGSNDIFPGEGAPLGEQFPWLDIHPDHAHAIVTNGAHHASDEAEMASGARVLTKLDHQGVVGGERRPVTTVEVLGDITAAESYAAHYGLTSEQDSVVLMRDITGDPKAPKYHGAGAGRGIGISVDIPVRDQAHAEDLLHRLAVEEGGALRAIGSRSSVVPSADGTLHIRTLWEPKGKGNRVEFNKTLKESGLADQLGDEATITERSVEYLRVENDWTANPDGSGYLDLLERGSHRHPVIRTPEQRVPLVEQYDAAYQAALKSGDAKAIKIAKKEMEVARATPAGRPTSEVRQLARDARLRVRSTVGADFDKYAAREVRHERERVLGEARDANADGLGTDPTYDAVLDGARASNGERLYERTPGGTVRAAVTRSSAAGHRAQLFFNRTAVTPRSVLHEEVHRRAWQFDDSANRLIAGMFNGMEGTPYGTWTPGTPLNEAQHEWLVDQTLLWASDPDAVHPTLAPLLKHLAGQLGAERTLRSAGTAPTREAVKRLDNALLILKAKRATLKSKAAIGKVDAAISNNRAQRAAAIAEGKRVKAAGGLSPEMKQILDDLANSAGMRSETRSSTFHAEEQDMLEWAQIAMGGAQRRANDLVHMRGERSMLERSINHPFLGLYPASYMYGKVLPYMAEFLMFRPFGIKTAPGNALAIGNRMHESFERQQQYDPELRDFLYKNEPFLRAMSLFVPGVPWDLPSGAPFWMRRIIETWLNNAEHRMYGEKEEEVDIPGLIANSAMYNLTLRGPDSWDSIIGAAQQAPDILESMITGKAKPPQPQEVGQPIQ